MVNIASIKMFSKIVYKLGFITFNIAIMLRNKILMWIWETPQSSCVLSVEFLEAMINGSFYVLFKDPASRQTPRVADGSGRPLAPQWSWCAPACSKPDASTRSIYAGSACGHRRTPNTCCSSTRGIAAGWRTVTLAAATWGIRGSILWRYAADVG